MIAQTLLLRLLVFLFHFAIFFCSGMAALRQEKQGKRFENGFFRATGGFWVMALPIGFLAWVLFLWLISPKDVLAAVQTGVQYLLAYLLYSLLMLALLPRLRKRYTAQSCALLWVLPSASFVLSVRFFYVLQEAVVQIRLGRTLLTVLLAVWAAGFLAVLAWKLLSHWRFRRRLLKDAVPACAREKALYHSCRATVAGIRNVRFLQVDYPRGTELLRDRDLMAMQLTEQPKLQAAPAREVSREDNKNRYNVPDSDALLRSPAADSPLAIGLFRRTIRVVLPMREYSDDELRLIFRHEICHLMRSDNSTKLLMAIQTAFGWFLPSMWLGMERSAQDAELACDELATAGLTEDERKQYAALLLTHSGAAAGFTTCLSASKEGLRYRLTRVLHPKQRRVGVVMLSLIVALFLSCFSLVGFAVEAGTMREAVFDRSPDGALLLQTGSAEFAPSPNADALHAMLDDVVLYRDLTERTSAYGARLLYFALDNTTGVYLYENGVTVVSQQGAGRFSTECYLTQTPIDGAAIARLCRTEGD